MIIEIWLLWFMVEAWKHSENGYTLKSYNIHSPIVGPPSPTLPKICKILFPCVVVAMYMSSFIGGGGGKWLFPPDPYPLITSTNFWFRKINIKSSCAIL